MNLLKGGDISNSTIANNPQDINDQIACKFLRRQIIGRNTLYEGNIRKTSVSPGELIEPGYNTEASTRNLAREAQNINDENDHATTRKSPMEPAGTNPSTELHHLGDSHVDSMTNSLQNANDENSHITYSMESAEANQCTTKKNELKSSWSRAESQFNDQTRRNLHRNQYNSNHTIVLELSVEMAGNHTLLEEELAHTTVE